ncbi:MAG: L-seryl-tRNA(Sec) selenium transferase [candidate division KSB1 bacterium]|nr:L-seryl-tRNA(Sec) selenium transferase [candidate division KSB1 bacterium]MDZ7365579.1 L-seryl-tRNA(Sec) selenium transferase [candidate division KSB1 bacterium]MDZ7403681.1 L-seryl-tRNA(Sec) selenium transferase [candidate division KSB1 bacterium]
MRQNNSQNLALRQLPAVEKVLQVSTINKLTTQLPPVILTDCVRRAVSLVRERWKKNPPAHVDADTVLQHVVQLTLAEAQQLLNPSLKRVINGTGVILHTGLGRAVLPPASQELAQEILAGYCNLEIDLATGERGDRHVHVEKLLCQLTGAEAACVVNNNAAAVLLVLNTMAFGREVIISRGQLVEIGGAFRMPEVIRKSGAKMVEVGTTNKTKISDYAAAITPKTAALLAVHTSNYRVLGFTQEVHLDELVKLGHKHDLPAVHDLGGGVLLDLRKWGLPYEPVVGESIRAGASIVTFSGDKVLGGPQCGLIVGEKSWISKIKKNPLMRALRCDKVTLALLESTLRLFLQPKQLMKTHPVWRMLTEKPRVVRARAVQLQKALVENGGASLEIMLRPSEAEAGSGALPIEKIPSFAVGLRSQNLSATELAKKFRLAAIPVLGYLRDESFWLDARTLHDDEIPIVAQMAGKIIKSSPGIANSLTGRR